MAWDSASIKQKQQIKYNNSLDHLLFCEDSLSVCKNDFEKGILVPNSPVSSP
jgi:hypothetical protein